MFELLFARFFARNVSRIIAGLDKMEARLAAFAQRQLDEALVDDSVALQMEIDAEEVRAKADEKREEAERALRVAGRINGITK